MNAEMDISKNQFGWFHSNPHFDLVSWLLALEASELVSEPVTQMAVELINIHLISVQQKCKCCILFHVKTTTKK
jgi:AhpD family alkylhydroperoxidase